MNRAKMEPLFNVRARFSGIVARFGEKSSYKGPPLKTLMLTDVRYGGAVITDHLWFTHGRWSKDLDIGDKIEFDARVTTYEKGYRGHREDAWDAPPPSIDYRLSHPTKVVKKMNIREATLADLASIVELAYRDPNALGFIPSTKYEEIINNDTTIDRLLVGFIGGEVIGFCYTGHNRHGVMRVYQLYVQENVDREEQALSLLEASILPRDVIISLKEATELECNAFWDALGFEMVMTLPPKTEHSRPRNLWRKVLTEKTEGQLLLF